MIRVALLTILSFVGSGALAQVHKCVDASGKVTYSQSPCPTGARAAPIVRAVPSAPASAPAAGDAAKGSGPKTAAELEQEFRKRQQERDEALKKEEQKLADAKTKEQNCANARQRLASIDMGLRQSAIDAKGERYFLDDAQVERERANAKKAAEQWCN